MAFWIFSRLTFVAGFATIFYFVYGVYYFALKMQEEYIPFFQLAGLSLLAGIVLAAISTALRVKGKRKGKGQ